MKREVVKAVGWGLLFTAILALLIIVGSRSLSRFDTALVAYTFASLFAVLASPTVMRCGCNTRPPPSIGSAASRFLPAQALHRKRWRVDQTGDERFCTEWVHLAA